MITSLIQVYFCCYQNKSAVTTVTHQTMCDVKNVRVQQNPLFSQTWRPYGQGFQYEPAAGKIHWLFHVNSPPTYFYPSFNKVFMCCQKNSMMSVFCSNTLIFTPECWKYILRGPVFKFFPEACAFSAPKSCLCRTFFPSPPIPKLLPPT